MKKAQSYFYKLLGPCIFIILFFPIIKQIYFGLRWQESQTLASVYGLLTITCIYFFITLSVPPLKKFFDEKFEYWRRVFCGFAFLFLIFIATTEELVSGKRVLSDVIMGYILILIFVRILYQIFI